MKNYILQKGPVKIPVPDNKQIFEHFGLASSGDVHISVAFMIAPPGWQEPHQTPEFDEITLMVRGKKQIEADGDIIELQAGESIYIKKGSRVRYSNPFAENAEYVSICLPAFEARKAHRDQE